MSTIIDSAVIIKSYNNNIVSVKINGQERVLLGKGIRFGKRFGDIIEKGTEVKKYLLLKMKIT